MNPTKKQKAAPLAVRERDHYHARPSTTEPGLWTVMEQLAGETSLRLFARARDVQAAAKILYALGCLPEETDNDPIPPVAIVVVSSGAPFAERVYFNVYGDGSVFRAIGAHGIPTDRVPKREHAAWISDDGRTLAQLVAEILGGGS